MGGHGGSSGFLSKAKQAKIKAEADAVSEKLANGEISLGEAMKQKKAIVQKYGITPKELTDIQWGGTGGQVEALKKAVEAKKNQTAQEPNQTAQEPSATTSVDVSNLPGQNGNPWPPNADGSHIAYSEGGGLAIWTQLGGGVANGGVSSQTAKDMNAAVKAYTGSQYGLIRDAYIAGDTTSGYGKKATAVQAFIDKSIETGNGWTGGPTYRGIGGLSDSTWKSIVGLKPGESVDCNLSAPASWSTHRQTAEGFGGSKNHITFVHLGSSQKGVSVDHISTCEGENEVLVSGTAKFRVVAVSPTKHTGSWGSNTYVYVEDAD